MRWGVRDEATDDHMTTELCMKEIQNCQRLSMGPNFVVRKQINTFYEALFRQTRNTVFEIILNIKLLFYDCIKNDHLYF